MRFHMTQKPERCRSLLRCARFHQPHNRRENSRCVPTRNLQPAIIDAMFPFFQNAAPAIFENIRDFPPQLCVHTRHKNRNIVRPTRLLATNNHSPCPIPVPHSASHAASSRAPTQPLTTHLLTPFPDHLASL